MRRERRGCPWCGTNLSGSAETTASHVVTEGADIPEDVESEELLTSALSVGFWRRLFLIVAAVLAVLFIVMGTFAVYQGLNDRVVADARSAIDHYEKGRSYYEEGRFELAAAEFQEALRLKPDFEAARVALALAETGVSGETGEQGVMPLPTPAETRQLWAEAVEAYNAGNYLAAIDSLEQIQALDPSFKTDEVEELLFDAYVTVGTQAVEDGDFEDAVRSFDQALALQPENSTVLRSRRLASAYQRGIEALEDENWQVATLELRRVYVLDSTYHDVVDKLAEAHRRYGDEFYARDIWCDAAEQYRQSDVVQSDSNVADRAAVAESRCSRQTVVSPAPTSAAGTVITDTQTITPTATSVPGNYAYVVNSDPYVDFSEACTGHYIKGLVLNEEEAPLIGVTVTAVDEWGNRFVAQSKSEPAGSYDMPINSIKTSYQVYVIGTDGEPASPMLTVTHDDSLSAADRACHVVTWQRVNDAEG